MRVGHGAALRLGEYVDETSHASTWHVPKAHYLEAWGDARTWDGTWSVQQPLILPLYGGKSAVELLTRLGVTGKAVLVDVAVDDNLGRSVRNLPGIVFVASSRLTARAVANAGQVVATRSALEKLQEVLSA